MSKINITKIKRMKIYETINNGKKNSEKSREF